MALEQLQQALAASGWQNLHPEAVQNIAFDLVGERRFTLTKWRIMVKHIPQMDQTTASQWQQQFEGLNEAAKSWIWGSCFLLCLLADEIDPAVATMLKGDSFGLGGVLRLKGGGGNILIADTSNGQVWGKIPPVPLDVHKFTSEARDVLQRYGGTTRGTSGQAPATQATPTAAQAESPCPQCGQPVRAGARFCDNCGAALQKECPECHQAVKPGARFCDNCGARLDVEPKSQETAGGN